MKPFYFSKLLIIAAILLGCNLSANAQVSVYTTTGSAIVYTVPAGLTLLSIDMQGAKGGNSSSAVSVGGNGGRVQCKLAVSGGEVLNIWVGAVGLNGTSTAGAGGSGWTGVCGNGGNGGFDNSTYIGGGGGGASVIVGVPPVGSPNIANVLIVAAGGGGAGHDGVANQENGGYGGGLTGQTGISINVTGGGGGPGNTTAATNGAGGTYPGGAWAPGTAGTQIVGGSSGSGPASGGGGGGYYGGGGGSWGGGGGGSSYASAAVTSVVTHTQNYNAGSGSVTITQLCAAVLPGTIVGAANMCPGGLTQALSNPTGSTGGTWSSSNTAVASVNAVTGFVTSGVTGSAVITYSVTGCTTVSTNITISVYPSPSTITTPNPLGFNVCSGQSISLASDPGGTWSSSNTSKATVDGSGNVTGIAAGTSTITYFEPGTGCPTWQPVTVNVGPSPITPAPPGGVQVCIGSTVNLFDGTPGGTWTSGFTPVATVNPGNGMVGGVNGGSAPINYTLANGCSVSEQVSVNGLPALNIASPANGSYCAGSTCPTIQLSGSISGVSYQLYNDLLPVGSAIIGAGLPLNFGVHCDTGTYKIIATNSNGCSQQMLVTPIVAINPPPLTETVTGGGPFCMFGGATICLSGTVIGTTYQLLNSSASPIGSPLPGNGSPRCFPLIGTTGTYTVSAKVTASGCISNMVGSASVLSEPLPDPQVLVALTPPGTGAYCDGGTGVNIGLEFSVVGVKYYLYLGGGSAVDSVLGTGSAISFGLQTATGTYVAQATNITTGCTNTMEGSVTVSTVSPPPTHNLIVIGSSSYCIGATGVDIQLDGSDGGINYQLYNGVTPVGSWVTGTGGGVDFGTYPAGTYTAVAIDATYGCVSNMAGSITVNAVPAPTAYAVSGGGSYCLVGGTPNPVILSGSQPSVTYTLDLGGIASGSPAQEGTGGPLNFGSLPVAGTYTIVAVNDTAGCANNMSGSATIIIDPPPPIENVTGGGNYCAGSSGMDVGLDFSSIGVNYQLFNSGVPAGAVTAGTGTPLDFGLHTAAGTYTVVATNIATGCTATMAGSATITINPLPLPHTITGGGQFCAVDSGKHIGLMGSDGGISYQLYNSGTPMGGAMAGTGASLDFGLQTVAGVYTVVAMDTITLCTKTMTGIAVIVVDPLPSVFTVTGGGVYCVGGTGAHIGLSGSNGGVQYQLFKGGALRATVTGSGFAIDFGAQTDTGVYTVVGMNTATTCTNNMSGSAVIMINPLPAVYTVTGGGNYCLDGTGFNVGLSGSDAAINYQLYRNGTAVAGGMLPGTGASLDFGTQTAAGVYTVIATDAVAGCIKNMAGSATITINSLPVAYTVLGGGNYCTGGTGYHVYMSNSATGVNYQLLMGTDSIGAAVPGTGVGIDLGLQSAPGTYTVVATSTITTCSNNMSGSATINLNPLPTAHSVTAADSGNYCITGSGVLLGLDGSDAGIHYQLYRGGTFLGAPVTGTGLPLNFGIHTAGAYSIVATNVATTCSSIMNDTVAVSAVPLPTVYPVTGGGNYCETGLGVHVGLSNSDPSATYQLYFGGAPVGVPVPGIGSSLDFGLETASGTYTVVAGNGVASCNSNMSGSAVVTVYPVIIPVVHVASNYGDTVCIGQLTTFTATPINGGPSPSYQWMVNGVAFGAGNSYSYVPVDGDVVTAMLTSNAICAIPDTGSRSVRITVSPQEMPAVHVTADPGDIICQGSPVTFTAATMYGGSAPAVTWLKNSLPVATSGLTYSYTPVNHDIIVVQMNSNFPCLISNNVFSNTNTMEVDPAVIPTVAIAANPGENIATGESVTFTATVLHGGPAPAYQWLINGISVHGATNATFTSSVLVNNDSVTCEVVGGCALSGFNSVIMHIANVGVQQVTSAGSDVMLVPNPNKGTFTVKGTMGTASEEVSFEVTNMLGQVIYTNKVMTQNGMLNEKIQLSNNLANGMYILNLRSGTQNNIFHFVIEQ